MKNTLKTLVAVAFVAVAFSSCKPKEEAKTEEVIDTVQVATEDTTVVVTDTAAVATDTTAHAH